jgi:hypothetical protein
MQRPDRRLTLVASGRKGSSKGREKAGGGREEGGGGAA